MLLETSFFYIIDLYIFFASDIDAILDKIVKFLTDIGIEEILDKIVKFLADISIEEILDNIIKFLIYITPYILLWKIILITVPLIIALTIILIIVLLILFVILILFVWLLIYVYDTILLLIYWFIFLHFFLSWLEPFFTKLIELPSKILIFKYVQFGTVEGPVLTLADFMYEYRIGTFILIVQWFNILFVSNILRSLYTDNSGFVYTPTSSKNYLPVELYDQTIAETVKRPETVSAAYFTINAHAKPKLLMVLYDDHDPELCVYVRDPRLDLANGIKYIDLKKDKLGDIYRDHDPIRVLPVMYNIYNVKKNKFEDNYATFAVFIIRTVLLIFCFFIVLNVMDIFVFYFILTYHYNNPYLLLFELGAAAAWRSAFFLSKFIGAWPTDRNANIVELKHRIKKRYLRNKAKFYYYLNNFRIYKLFKERIYDFFFKYSIFFSKIQHIPPLPPFYRRNKYELVRVAKITDEMKKYNGNMRDKYFYFYLYEKYLYALMRFFLKIWVIVRLLKELQWL